MTAPDETPQPEVAPPEIAPPEIAPPEIAECSAKGCRAPATWQLLWNNPKLHTPERRKIWLACDEHRTSLGDFLGARKFLRDVVPFAPDAG